MFLQGLAFSTSSENEEDQLALQKEAPLSPRLEDGEEAPILRIYVAGKQNLLGKAFVFVLIR